MKLKKYSKELAILLLACLLLAFSFEDIKLSSYAQKKQHYKIINTLQPRLDEGDTPFPSSFFYWPALTMKLATTTKQSIRRTYCKNRLIRVTEVMLALNLTVYPQILRGYIYLEQGEPKKAVEEGTLAYKLLHEEGRERNGFYKSQLISIYDVLGVAYALDGNNVQAQKIANSLQDVRIEGIIGPEKYGSLGRIYVALKEYDHALTAIKIPIQNSRDWPQRFS